MAGVPWYLPSKAELLSWLGEKDGAAMSDNSTLFFDLVTGAARIVESPEWDGDWKARYMPDSKRDNVTAWPLDDPVSEFWHSSVTVSADGARFTIFAEPNATPAQIDAAKHALRRSQDVTNIEVLRVKRWLIFPEDGDPNAVEAHTPHIEEAEMRGRDMATATILIEVLGGNVVQVRCTDPSAEVILLDHDNEKEPEYVPLDGDELATVQTMQANDDLIVF